MDDRPVGAVVVYECRQTLPVSQHKLKGQLPVRWERYIIPRLESPPSKGP